MAQNPCERRIAAMPAGSKRLPECSPIFSNCFVRSVSNCLSSSENASGDLDGRHLVQSAADSVLCQIWHNPEPSDKHISASPTKFYEILGKRSETFSKSVTVPSGNRVVEVHLSSANGWIRQTRQCEVSVPPGLRKQPGRRAQPTSLIGKRKSNPCRWTSSGACRQRQKGAIADMSSSGAMWFWWAFGRITSTTSFSSNFSKQHEWHLHAFESALRATGEIDFLRRNSSTGKCFQGISVRVHTRCFRRRSAIAHAAAQWSERACIN